MTIKNLINGKFVDELAVHDRGLHYGDGLFETIMAENKQLLCWDEHLKRLERGCIKLNIAVPDKNISGLTPAKDLFEINKILLKLRSKFLIAKPSIAEFILRGTDSIDSISLALIRPIELTKIVISNIVLELKNALC